ncbi:PGR5-like protein 1A [Picochlorum sp. SENEW3]|nr:PGR5-like protein 1A [Picochlorum sp. SENEW3]
MYAVNKVQGVVSLGVRNACPRLVQRPCTASNRFRVKANEDSEGCGANINDYCSIDMEGGKPVSQMTLGEKEQAFLEALSAFYYDGTPSISDEEFDLLKDELLWSGSKVAVLSSNEKRFLEATMAYNAGKPIISNEEFDELKNALRQEGSAVTFQGARCSIRSRKMYSDANVDYLRMLSLNAPAAVTVLAALFSIDDLTGFEVTQLMELPEPFGIIVVWGVILPAVYVLSNAITNLVFRDALVLKAQCPNCGTENVAYFGDIFTVSGNRDANIVECSECKSKLRFDAKSRQVVVQEPEEPAKKEAAPASS